MPDVQHKRIEQPGPQNGHCYIGQDPDWNRYIPSQFEEILEDHDGCRRADHTEHPADDYSMSERPVQHDAGRMRFSPLDRSTRSFEDLPLQRESSDTPN